MSRGGHRYDYYFDEEVAESLTPDSNGLESDFDPNSPITIRAQRHHGDVKPPRPPDRLTERRPHSKVAPPSEEMDSIPTVAEAAHDVKQVYVELQEINNKLKREFKVLHDRDVILKQKEKSLQELQQSLNTAIENEVKRRLHNTEQEHRSEIMQLEDSLRDKNKENRRLKENFDSLKSANDILRKELDTLTHSQDKLQKQYHSLQARFINLQRRKDPVESRPEPPDSLPSDLAHKVRLGILTAKQKSVAAANKKPKVVAGNLEVTATLLDWVCESQLRQTVQNAPTRLPDPTSHQEVIEDRCFKLLPSMVDLLRDQTQPQAAINLPSLQFIYWSLVHLESSQSQHLKTSLSTTLRRLGGDLYRGYSSVSPDSDSQERPRESNMFFRSGHLHTRLLSSLIILRTGSQVDYLAQVYDVLRNDLKTDSGREFFLFYQATPIMLTHLKPSNKALTSSALDVYLQMAMDSPYLRAFLDSCSSEPWFQAVSLVWRMPGIESKQHEKISIILQKLSKIKSNKRYFEVFGLTTSCQELQRSALTLSPFLNLNLKSILYNLSAATTNTTTKPKSAS